MYDEQITLRQRKLLNYLQNQTSLVSGGHLASFLHVSVRTLRNDITDINANLASVGISIISQKSKGYYLEVANPDILKELTQKNESFATREDRVRYLAFTLCLSDEPIDMYELEDEMFVSHTTLEHDLHHLNMQYVLSYPRIALIQKKGYLAFERNERKRRAILTRLFCDDWNYHTRENAYYSYDYLDKEQVDLIMEKVSFYLNKYAIRLEDKGRVSLNLALAVMYERTITGHELQSDADAVIFHNAMETPTSDGALEDAIRELLDDLENIFQFKISAIEREEIFQMAAHNRLMDTSQMSFLTIPQYFSREVLDLIDRYLVSIRNTFHLDFSEDEDFYITLAQYIRYLKLPYYSFNVFQLNPNLSRNSLKIAFEIAVLFQDLAPGYLGYYLNHTELLYLAFCISGALEYLHRPEGKQLKAAICCHLNLTATWALKRKILSKFDYFLHIEALLPINATQIFDFSTVDLVLTTVNKPITDCPTAKVLYVSPFMTAEDCASLENLILQKRRERISTPINHDLMKLLQDAFWHELIVETNKLSLLHTLVSDFMDAGYVNDEYYEDMLRRESISTFAFAPNIVLVYSLRPSSSTCLSVATLKHRMTWNSYKIRTVIAAALRPEDAPLIFRLMQWVYDIGDNSQKISHIKTKKELLEFFSENQTKG